MTWLNDQHHNVTPPLGHMGGSKCTCEKCNKRKCQKCKAELSEYSSLSLCDNCLEKEILKVKLYGVVALFWVKHKELPKIEDMQFDLDMYASVLRDYHRTPKVEDGKCYLCKIVTNSLSANPNEWSVVLPYPGGNGKSHHYHWGCVYNKMFGAHNGK